MHEKIIIANIANVNVSLQRYQVNSNTRDKSREMNH